MTLRQSKFARKAPSRPMWFSCLGECGPRCARLQVFASPSRIAKAEWWSGALAGSDVDFAAGFRLRAACLRSHPDDGVVIGFGHEGIFRRTQSGDLGIGAIHSQHAEIDIRTRDHCIGNFGVLRGEFHSLPEDPPEIIGGIVTQTCLAKIQQDRITEDRLQAGILGGLFCTFEEFLKAKGFKRADDDYSASLAIGRYDHGMPFLKAGGALDTCLFSEASFVEAIVGTSGTGSNL